MENLLKRALKFKGLIIPSSESWHKKLLEFSVNNQIISLDLSLQLDEYRAFRHFFIHGYGIILENDKLAPLAEKIFEVWTIFESEFKLFLSSIE